MSDSPLWDGQSLLEFECEFHKHSYKENELRVTLYASGDTQPVSLGVWSEDINDYADKIKQSPADFFSKLRQSNVLREGEMMWCITRKPFNREVAEQTRKKLALRLSIVISWLDRIIEDAKALGVAIDANIAFPFHGKRTMLHAAVYLQDQKLIKKLLELGADPYFSESMESSPQKLATMSCYNSESRREKIYELLNSQHDSKACRLEAGVRHNCKAVGESKVEPSEESQRIPSPLPDKDAGQKINANDYLQDMQKKIASMKEKEKRLKEKRRRKQLQGSSALSSDSELESPLSANSRDLSTSTTLAPIDDQMKLFCETLKTLQINEQMKNKARDFVSYWVRDSSVAPYFRLSSNTDYESARNKSVEEGFVETDRRDDNDVFDNAVVVTCQAKQNKRKEVFAPESLLRLTTKGVAMLAKLQPERRSPQMFDCL
eukprot:CAMPEP_0172429652 /NCGR_PEP_ID=MMETSP1064-20121228/51249_1 /TAXON_ID=202472 /ORGANISM="Aulacoseira subarctica , Strain CCAP 1002/5" /LENGTH=432 /DNA_ID=CAMNT_0013175201 /DNA_START=44 /DNA_END=1342 /DNA_ORIENTATION=-